jgi:hypothetical protein
MARPMPKIYPQYIQNGSSQTPIHHTKMGHAHTCSNLYGAPSPKKSPAHGSTGGSLPPGGSLTPPLGGTSLIGI